MDERQEQSEGTLEELRLFPLNVVLLPGMTMPLRIFEERYKLMIGECLEAGDPFGVVLIKDGMGVGGPATPHEVGTTARITEVEKLEEGRMNLSTVGERRFLVVETMDVTLYLKGRVRYLTEEMGDVEEGVADRARELFGEYLRSLAGLRGGWLRQAVIATDDGLLSYSIAQYLELPARARQRLLELPCTGERLTYEIPLLDGANQRTREALIKRSPYKGARLN